jgi:miniconductance mechanosensitive channel
MQAAIRRKLFFRLSHLAPALVIYATIPLLKLSRVAFTEGIVTIAEKITIVYMLCIIFSVIASLLKVIEDMYHGLENSHGRPIKSYLQIILLFFYVITIILIISVLLDKSPLVFFTGLGAMMAIIMVIFKDTLMGLVANIQNTQSDIMHIGDWVEIPQYNVDGDVIDISLNTIKVQNFDKTIVTVPTQTILNGGIKNWRGMQEFGGRRIKRAVSIDIRSIKFCTPAMLEKFSKMPYIADHIEQHTSKQLTNIGLFRVYLQAYLKQNKYISQNFTFLVRHLAPTDKGLPVEIYVFTNDTDWVAYENIQADIFDHVLAIVPQFELKIFQSYLSV